MRHFIGFSMIVSPFVCYFYVISKIEGVWEAVKVFSLGLSGAAVVVVGIILAKS